MNRYTKTNVWNDPRSYYADPFYDLAEIERIEKLARQAKWRGRVSGFCKFAALFVLFVVSFQIGRGL